MVNLFFTGDFFALHPKKIQLSENLKHDIKNSDLAFVNFEAPIISDSKPIKKSGPNIAQSKESISFLKSCGFNLYSLGNNHSMDFGKDGLIGTLQMFENDEILGAGDFESAYNCLIKEINDLKLGFISLSHYEFGMSQSSDKNYGIAWINDPIVDDLIRENSQKCDFLFVLPHAGVENIDLPLPEWRERYKRFIDLGAAAVIASHPHVPQGFEFYKHKPIFYSLGNFFFEPMKNNYPNLIAEILNVKIDDDKKIDFDLKFIKRYDWKIDYLNQEDSQVILNKLNQPFHNEDLYYHKINSIVKDLYKKTYKRDLKYALRKLSFREGLMFNAKIIAKTLLKRNDSPLLLNNFRCESHRWVIQRALQNEITC